MNRYSGSSITQQMYTRERRGVYRSTEGFDTVAKSESLDNNFVKKMLHPFCLYDAPAELTARGEKNEAAYPAALHLFHTETNDTVIGSSRYQAADFTGQRSAFFAHNFVVPAARAEDIVQSYGDWLHADFAESYTGELGGTLPELASIPVLAGGERHVPLNPLAVLRSLNIGEGLFKALLQAVMTSVAGKKKIYVALDVPISELSVRAAELTEILFGALPYEYRRRLGVITYASEPKSRKYIHLTFVEKSSLRSGDRSIEKDFVFDLASGRTSNADFSQSRQPYADLVWKSLQKPGGSIDDFARFSDNMLRAESAERRLSLAVYNKLAVFYEIEQGNESLYQENKSAVLGGLLSYLKGDGAIESRVRLNDMFLERFDREYDLIRQKGILEPAMMESFKQYFSLRGHNYKVKVVDYFINGMLNSTAAGREDVLSAAYGIIESDDELSASFFKRVLAQPVFRKQLLEPYMEARLAAAARSADILSFVVHWGRVLPEALRQAFVRDTVRDYLVEKLQREQEPVAAVASIHDTIEKAEKERRRGAEVHPEVLTLLQELTDAADRFLLNRLSFAELTQEQLLEITFLQYRHAADWQPPLDLISKQKANALHAAYRWFGEEKPNEEIFKELAPKELDDVQLLGRRWLKEAQTLEPFERLPLAFYHTSYREGGPLDYEALLEMIKRKAGADKETMYRFFAWSQGNPLFSVSNKKLWASYRRAILKYFLSSDREAFKSREFRKGYATAAGPALQNVYNEARSELASPLARWVSRRRFQLLISGSITGIVLIVAIIAISMLQPDAKETALPVTSPLPSAAGNVAGEVPPAAVYLQAATGSEEGGSLRFAFANAADCISFNPENIGVVATDGTVTTLKIAAMTRTCSLPSPEAGGSSGQEGTSATGVTDDAAADKEAKNDTAADKGATDDTAADKGATGDTAADKGATDDTAADKRATGDTAAPGAAGNTATPSTGTTPAVPAYEVIVELASGATLKQGNTIKAGEYTLNVQADPGQAVPSEPPATDGAIGSEPDPSATASPEA